MSMYEWMYATHPLNPGEGGRGGGNGAMVGSGYTYIGGGGHAIPGYGGGGGGGGKDANMSPSKLQLSSLVALNFLVFFMAMFSNLNVWYLTNTYLQKQKRKFPTHHLSCHRFCKYVKTNKNNMVVHSIQMAKKQHRGETGFDPKMKDL